MTSAVKRYVHEQSLNLEALLLIAYRIVLSWNLPNHRHIMPASLQTLIKLEKSKFSWRNDVLVRMLLAATSTTGVVCEVVVPDQMTDLAAKLAVDLGRTADEADFLPEVAAVAP